MSIAQTFHKPEYTLGTAVGRILHGLEITTILTSSSKVKVCKIQH